MLPLVGSAYNVGGGRIISANDSSPGMSITQSGSGYILKLVGPSSNIILTADGSQITATRRTYVVANPDVTPNYGLFNIGPGPWDGTSAGHYVGSGQGGGFVANFAAGYTGDHIRTQVQGVDRFRVVDNAVYLGYAGNGVDVNVYANGNLWFRTLSLGTTGIYFPGGTPFNFATNGGLMATNQGPTTVPLISRGDASQTADLFRAQDSAGTVLAGIEASGTIYTKAGIAAARRTVTTTDQATINDYSIWCDATAAAFTETLPAANTCKNGQMIAVTKIDSGANAVTVKGSGTDTVNGAASIALSALDSTAILITDGVSKWWEIG